MHNQVLLPMRQSQTLTRIIHRLHTNLLSPKTESFSTYKCVNYFCNNLWSLEHVSYQIDERDSPARPEPAHETG